MDRVTLLKDKPCRATWVEMRQQSIPCFDVALLDNMLEAGEALGNRFRREAGIQSQPRLSGRDLFQVTCSDAKDGTFSLGGDLAAFVEWIEAGNEAKLRRYAGKCIELLDIAHRNHGAPIETIAVVEGEALGGGFECALAHRRIIADPRATFGFPEVKFGMFPGMGAVSALTRKIGAKRTQTLIMDGCVITCEQAAKLGIVDIVANIEGDARGAASRYMARIAGNPGKMAALEALLITQEPLPLAELMKINSIWIDNALQLSQENIELMRTILKSQGRKYNGE